MTATITDLSVDREIRHTRVFDAPRELVWKALTDPAHMDAWWGPDGFTNTTQKIDVRPGGSWVFTMRGPDGKDYPNAITFRELVAPERLAFRHGETEAENPDEDFNTVITLEDVGGKTRLTMTGTFKDKAARDFVIREFHALEGGKQHLEKLADHLERMSNADTLAPEDREIRSSRLFDAPRETLWEAFRNPSRLAKWWGPAGFSNEFQEFDFRPGGVWRLVMRGADGKKYPMKKVFVEMSAPEKIVLDHIDPVHGFRMFMSCEERAGKTELAWRVLFHSAEEAARVRSFFLAANEENFDRLGEYLTRESR